MVKPSEQEIMEIISRALNLKDRNVLTSDNSIDNTEEWDSLGHLSILSALDNFYHGKIAQIREMAKADSVAKILQILRKHSFL